MIARLRGTLAAVAPAVVIDVGGVGYRVSMTPQALSELPPIGEEVVVHTHLHVREDEMSLYGFLSAAERDLFRILISTIGVGPKVGMALLSTLRPDQLRRAILSEDAGALAAAPGVGKRSAQRLILELRPKLADAEADVTDPGGSAQVRMALEQLGYRPDEINEVMAELDEDGSVQDQVKAALNLLGQARRA